MKLPEHILLQAVVGSNAYGLAHAGSDTDRGGVYASPPMDLLDLNRGKPEEDTYVQHDPEDMWLHEAKKFLRLALNCNPTVSEMVWMNEYEVITYFGLRLIDIRDSFLSANRVRNGYLGFATSQLHRFFGYDKVTEEGRKHSSKNARHLWRLLHQGLRAYQGEGIVVRLDPEAAEACRDFGDMAVDHPDQVERLLRDTESLFDAIKTPLPEAPDREPARRWLRDLRLDMMP